MDFNPFRLFRRNQKTWLFGATLLAMVSFLFLGVIIQLLGGRSGGGSSGGLETYAECRQYGSITNREVQSLQNEHDALGRFLAVLFQNAGKDAEEAKLRDLYPLRALAEQYRNRRDAETLIDAWLIVRYARTEGLSPTWADMQTYLIELSGGHLTEADIQKALKDIRMQRASVEYLLASHILEQQAMERFNITVSAVSPATRWDWFQRLYRKVAIEAAALPVKDFVGQVGEPTETQLQAFFEENKSKRYDPGLAESGLIPPAEIAFQYVIAEPNKKILDSITEDEMKTYYETNKDTLFRKPQKPLTEQPGLPSGTGTGAVPFPTPGKPIFNVPNPTSEPAAQPPAREEEKKLAEPKKEEAKPEEKKDGSKNEPATASPDEKKPETSYTGAVTRLVKYQTETPPVPPAVSPSTTGAGANEADKKLETPVDLSILYRPFDEVKETIRQTLAREKAAKGLPIIREKMNEFAKQYNALFEQRKAVPAMPDLSKLAAEQNLELKTVKLGDVYTAMHTEFASGLVERDHLIRMYTNIPINFMPEVFPGTNGDVLLWVTEQKAEKRPEKLDDVRELAVRCWKERQARTAMKAKAEELAAKAETSGKSLAETFKGEKNVTVVETEPFTWKTYGDGIHPITAIMQRQQPFYGEVREKGIVSGNAIVDNKAIFMPGSEFMENVYALQLNGVGTALNQPQSTAYVVRLTGSSPSEESLREQFQTSFVMEYLYAGQPELMRSAYEAWLDDIRVKTGFKWIKKPERYGYGE